MREQRKTAMVFPVPSQDPDFLRAQEQPSKGEGFLAVLAGTTDKPTPKEEEPPSAPSSSSGRRRANPSPRARLTPAPSSDERESRLTVYLPTSLHQKLRVRVVSDETTITDWVRALITRELA